jgi:hypothetical protein
VFNWLTNINRRVAVTIESNSVTLDYYQADQGALSVIRNDSQFTGAISTPETRILRMPSTSTDIIGWSEQIQGYLELGEALSAMVGLEEDDEWRIDEPVYATACQIASKLMAASYPPPRIFSHGPESVVFDWSLGTQNRYLTISSNRISMLVSSPERIERRADYPLKQLPSSPALLPSLIQLSHQGQPLALIEVTSDAPRLFY